MGHHSFEKTFLFLCDHNRYSDQWIVTLYRFNIHLKKIEIHQGSLFIIEKNIFHF